MRPKLDTQQLSEFSYFKIHEIDSQRPVGNLIWSTLNNENSTNTNSKRNIDTSRNKITLMTSNILKTEMTNQK